MRRLQCCKVTNLFGSCLPKRLQAAISSSQRVNSLQTLLYVAPLATKQHSSMQGPKNRGPSWTPQIITISCKWQRIVRDIDVERTASTSLKRFTIQFRIPFFQIDTFRCHPATILVSQSKFYSLSRLFEICLFPEIQFQIAPFALYLRI